MPNVKDLNYIFSDFKDYLEIKENESDVKNSDKSHTMTASDPNSIDMCFHALNPLLIVIVLKKRRFRSSECNTGAKETNKIKVGAIAGTHVGIDC